MADLEARYESWREARERARLELAAGVRARLDAERTDDEFGDVTSGDALGRHDGRFKLALVQAALARELRPIDERIARALHRGRRARGARRAVLGARGSPQRAPRAARLRERARVRGGAAARGRLRRLAPRGGALPRTLRFAAARRRARAGRRLRVRGGAPRCAPARGARLRARRDAARPRARAGAADRREPRRRASARGRRAARSRRGVARVRAERRCSAALEALFGAAGEALHLAFTSSALSLTKRVLGDPATGLAFGEVARALFAEPGLGAQLAGVDPAHFAAARAPPRPAAARRRAGRGRARGRARAREGSAPAPRRPSSATRARSPRAAPRSPRSTRFARPASGRASQDSCARASDASTGRRAALASS